MTNRLINEPSPYLRAHAHDEIDWFPWGEEAFDKARREDKPIFLSIGYSTCHWCHVMASEAFQNAEVAHILNAHYVSIKLDREERPDIDGIYMRACTALNISGGWPLNVLMTAEGKPFFVSTYLPREDAGQTFGLITVLSAIAHKWHTEREELLDISRDIAARIAFEPVLSPAAPDMETAKRAYAQLEASFDEEYGGFGTAPKFPSPHDLLFLLRYSAYTGDKKARTMCENTLSAMYKGGIYDHFGGGFSRYSTDREWLAPHFEKTLYDNALLAYVYTEAWEQGHMERWRSVSESTLDYCMRELLHPCGGYCAAQDADSNGEEGAYYLFTPQEVCAVLGDEAGRHFCECYDITAEGNYHGKSIPNLLINTRWALLPDGYDDYREKLRLYRAESHELKTDDKILTAWNGLMLAALSRAARVYADARYLHAAQDLAAFLHQKLFVSGELKGVYYPEINEARVTAKLDDYVFYALGLIELYEADFDAEHLLLAEKLAEYVDTHFADGEGGYYRTADTAEKLIVRPREVFDGAMPSANSGAAVMFDMLFRLTGNVAMRDRRDKLLAYTFAYAKAAPAGCAYALCALMSAANPTREVLVTSEDEDIPALLLAVTARYAPELTVLLKTPARAEALKKAAPFTATAEAENGKVSFFICENGACREATI